MNKSRKKIKVVGRRRPELDVERFADAIIALALNRLRDEHDDETEQPGGDEHGRAKESS